MATEFINGQWRIPNSWNVDESNQNKISNYSMDFDPASTDYIDLGSEVLFDSTSGFSFSTWVKLEAYSPNAFPPICKIKTDQATGYVIFVSNNSTYYGVNIGSNLNFIRARTDGNISADFIGTWKHICVTFDGVDRTVSSSFKIYVDGSSVNLTTTGGFASTANENTLGFGSNAGITFNGKIDQTCFFDYALSASQVSTLYGNSAAGYFQIGNPMALTPNPVAFYPLGDQDLIGAGYNGANWLVPNQVAGAFSSVFTSGGAAPGGSSATINLANPVPLGSNKTVSFWFKLSSSAQFNFSPFTATGADAGNCYYPYFITSTSTSLKWYVSDASCGGTGFLLIGGNGGAPGVDTWAHAAVVGDGSSVICYLNGVQVQQASSDRNPTIQRLIHAPTQLIEFSNFSIFNTNLSLTGTESITSLYNNGTPPDLTNYSNIIHWWKLNEKDTFNSATGNWTIKDYIGSNNGTSSSMTSASLVSSDLPSVTSGYSPYAVELNGTDQNFDLGTSLSLANELTISSWININNTTAGAKVIVYKGSNSSYEFGLEVNRTSGKLSTLATSSGPVFTSNTTLVAGSWYHAALTKTIVGATITYTFFLNGQPDGTGTTTLAPNYTSGITAIGKFGSSSGGYFNGKISNLALWNSGLSAAQVATIYNNGIPGDISSLNPLAWWELGSMMGFNGSDTYTALSNTDSNFAAVSTSNMAAIDLVNGPGYSNGGSGTSSLVIEKQAPYSFNNALSESMAISNRDDSQVSDPYPLMIELDLTGETSSYTFTTPILYTSGDISIDWGDGSAIQQTGTISNIRLTHVYDTDTYPRPLIQWGRSTDAGKISGFQVQGAGSRLNIFNLKQWGKSFNGSQINFNNAANMIITAQDIPDFSSLASMASMFQSCSSITTIPNIEKWDVSNKAVSAAQMFRFCSNFIATDLDNFADNVFTSQSAMFGNCTSLNSASFSKWRTRGSMAEAFEAMSSLDQDLSTKTVTRADGSTYIAWDISECTSLFQMLDYNSGFTGTNPNISNWDTSNLVGAGLGYLFLQSKMNSDISTKQISTPNPYNTTYTAWDVSGVTNFISLMQSNSIFNQNLRTWQLSESTTTLSQIFTSTAAFSDDNYTDTLVGWAVYLYGVENPPENLSLGNTSGLIFQDNRTVNSDDNGSTTTNYSSLYPSWPETWTQASDARDYLVETLGWSSTGTNPL